MRIIALIPAAIVTLLVSCHSARRLGDANFTAAINQYLANHGKACVLIGREFPIDIPRGTAGDPSGIAARMTALQRAGLVSETDATVVVHGMLDPLRGPTPPRPVRHYQLTADGQNFFRQVPGAVGSIGGFCYAQKAVDKIVNWTQPEAGSSEAEVTYTYKLQNLAGWAKQPDVERVFPDIRVMIDEASKANQIVGLQLTDTGWRVPES